MTSVDLSIESVLVDRENDTLDVRVTFTAKGDGIAIRVEIPVTGVSSLDAAVEVARKEFHSFGQGLVGASANPLFPTE